MKNDRVIGSTYCCYDWVVPDFIIWDILGISNYRDIKTHYIIWQVGKKG